MTDKVVRFSEFADLDKSMLYCAEDPSVSDVRPLKTGTMKAAILIVTLFAGKCCIAALSEMNIALQSTKYPLREKWQ